jgi:hypothetical protein
MPTTIDFDVRVDVTDEVRDVVLEGFIEGTSSRCERWRGLGCFEDEGMLGFPFASE